jgi:hypothetical protein
LASAPASLILANYTLPLNRALVVRNNQIILFIMLCAQLNILRVVQSLVWQWKCLSIIPSFLPNPVFALLVKVLKVALVLRLKVHISVCIAEVVLVLPTTS